jgi:hypothetical protein
MAQLEVYIEVRDTRTHKLVYENTHDALVPLNVNLPYLPVAGIEVIPRAPVLEVGNGEVEIFDGFSYIGYTRTIKTGERTAPEDSQEEPERPKKELIWTKD